MKCRALNFSLRFLSVITLATLFTFSSLAEAQYFQADFMKRRQADKESTRWTITDWMAQKKKIDLMSLWLAGNRSKSVFEMDLGGGVQELKVKTESGGVSVEDNYNSTRYNLSMFVYMVGVQGSLVDSDEGYKQWSANLNLRLLGSSQQNTRFNIKYGYRERELDIGNEKWAQQFAGAELNLYITHFMGVEGDYNYFFKDTSNSGTELSGEESRAGLFLEFGFLRLYGHYRHDRETKRLSGIDTKVRREGFEYGAKLSF